MKPVAGYTLREQAQSNLIRSSKCLENDGFRFTDFSISHPVEMALSPGFRKCVTVLMCHTNKQFKAVIWLVE